MSWEHTRRLARAASVATAVLFVVSVAAAPRLLAQSHDHPTSGSDQPDGKIGVLIADHGEPPEYNAWTYESFREFFQHLIAMGVIPSWLTALETGTILYDANCPACNERSDAPRLIDAWLRPHDGPAVFVPASDSLAAHYVVAGGPGFREPDIYEHVGLSAWDEWRRMGGRSPNYDEKLAKKTSVIERLRALHGEHLAVRVGYGIDPRIGGGRQGIREALTQLVNRDRVKSLVVVYHGVGFSDIMQTHHLRHQIAEHVEMLDVDLPIRYASPLGVTDAYVRAIVEKVRTELAKVPPRASVAVHLSGHGLPTTMCGDYDCGADSYHRYAADLFRRAQPAVEAAVTRPGRTSVFHIYGDGGEGESDPDDEVAGPIEALDARAAQGYTHVIDIPYEFDSNSRDTLIVLRHGYGRTPPDWNDAYESDFDYKGMRVRIANANGGEALKTDALFDVAARQLPSMAGTAPRTQTEHGSHSSPPRADTVAVAHHVATPRFDRVGAAAAQHGHTAAATAGAVAARHGHGGDGAPAGLGLLLALVGGGAIAGGVASWRRSLLPRLTIAAAGIQLAGLGWDVITHAGADEGVHLLENGGHWVAMGGLVGTLAVAIYFLREPEVSAASDS